QFLQSLLQYASVAATNVVGIAAVHVVAHVVEVAAAKDVHIVVRIAVCGAVAANVQRMGEMIKAEQLQAQRTKTNAVNNAVKIVVNNAIINVVKRTEQLIAAIQTINNSMQLKKANTMIRIANKCNKEMGMKLQQLQQIMHIYHNTEVDLLYLLHYRTKPPPQNIQMSIGKEDFLQ
ncbi:MAG: hypothetical protein EZS28_012990, partial [Streblomastix strix]